MNARGIQCNLKIIQSVYTLFETSYMYDACGWEKKQVPQLDIKSDCSASCAHYRMAMPPQAEEKEKGKACARRRVAAASIAVFLPNRLQAVGIHFSYACAPTW